MIDGGFPLKARRCGPGAAAVTAIEKRLRQCHRHTVVNRQAGNGLGDG
jgi:hypothetical protein